MAKNGEKESIVDSEEQGINKTLQVQKEGVRWGALKCCACLSKETLGKCELLLLPSLSSIHNSLHLGRLRLHRRRVRLVLQRRRQRRLFPGGLTKTTDLNTEVVEATK